MEAGLTLGEFVVVKEAGTLVQVATCEEEGGLVLVDGSCHMRKSTQTA